MWNASLKRGWLDRGLSSRKHKISKIACGKLNFPEVWTSSRSYAKQVPKHVAFDQTDTKWSNLAVPQPRA